MELLQWSTQDGVAHIMDVPAQPVAMPEVVRVLLDLATGAVEGDCRTGVRTKFGDNPRRPTVEP